MSTLTEQLAAIVAEVERHKQTVFCHPDREQFVRAALRDAGALDSIRFHTSKLCPNDHLWIIESDVERERRAGLPPRDMGSPPVIDFPRMIRAGDQTLVDGMVIVLEPGSPSGGVSR